MARYADRTTVSTKQTKVEIEGVLERYGTVRFQSGWEPGRAVIAFEAQGRRVRIDLPLPEPDDDEFMLTPTGLERSVKSARDAYEGEVRRRWRALLLVIKAKLEAIGSGITTFDREWLAYIQLDDGPTIGDVVIPQLDADQPLLLPEGGRP